LKPGPSFDLVCSFGLIEHFRHKHAVIDIHKTFVHSRGFVVIIVPLGTPLTRVFFEIHPELNFGYRELMTLPELRDCLEQENLNPINTSLSSGYVYDFAAVVCQTRENIR
jgi:hypothetical protein